MPHIGYAEATITALRLPTIVFSMGNAYLPQLRRSPTAWTELKTHLCPDQTDRLDLQRQIRVLHRMQLEADLVRAQV